MALFLQPVFKDRIWGGHALKAFNFGHNIVNYSIMIHEIVSLC